MTGTSWKRHWWAISIISPPTLAILLRNLRQCAWSIGNGHAKSNDPACADQAAHQHRCEQPCVNISAANDEADLSAGKSFAILHESRQRSSASTFGQHFAALKHCQYSRFHGELADQENFIDQPSGDFTGGAAGNSDRYTFGDGIAARCRCESVNRFVH